MTAIDCFGLVGSFKSCWGCTSKVDYNQQHNKDNSQIQDMKHAIGNYTRLFSFNELQKATNNFSTKLGMGDFSSCYMGTLENGTIVAVKVFKFRNADYKLDVEFKVLIKIMSQIRHPNVVEFIGCCVEDDHKIIVYEFMEGGSLAALLDDKMSELSWPMRASICLGIARGLESIHGHVLHRDFRPSNVLLDHSYNPKIVDFGMGHIFADYASDDNGNIPMNIGYIDPEYMICGGRSTKKTDVYAFGVLILEVISGRRIAQVSRVDMNSGREVALSLRDGKSLVNWAQQHGENGSFMEIIDPTLSEFPEDEAKRFIDAALSCVHSSLNVRPEMSEVSLMLSTL